MTFWQRLLGTRTQRAASGAASVAQCRQAATAAAAHLASLTGIVYTLHTVSNTNSMLPTMDANSVLLAEHVSYSALGEGDIVIYKLRDMLVVHRLNERTATGWWPLGDGNVRMDLGTVTPANYVSRVCAIFYGLKNAETDN